MNNTDPEVTRLRKALLILADACTADPDEPVPPTVLLAEDGDLDWSLTLDYLQSVMDGAQPCDALEDVANARTTPSEPSPGTMPRLLDRR